MKNPWSSWFSFDARPSRRRYLAAIAATVLGLALGTSPPRADARDTDNHWVGTWAASPQSVDPFTPANPPSFNGQTIRQIVHASIGGQKIRVRFTNELGADALTIGAAHVALQSTDSSIVAGSDRVLTFAGQGSVSIPKGAPMLSDPVDLKIPPLGQRRGHDLPAARHQRLDLSRAGPADDLYLRPRRLHRRGRVPDRHHDAVVVLPLRARSARRAAQRRGGHARRLDHRRLRIDGRRESTLAERPGRTTAGVAPLRAHRGDGSRHQRQPGPARHHRAERAVAVRSRRRSRHRASST